MSFADRRDAGRRLAARLRFLRGEDAVVLALPRGGVPVALEVAQALALPLDVIVVRKLGVPFQPELAMGAIGEGGVVVVNDEVLRLAGVTPRVFAEVEQRARAELDRQARRYRGHRPRPRWRGAPRWWSMTGSPPARRPGPPVRWPKRRARPGWCWQCRWRRRPR